MHVGLCRLLSVLIALALVACSGGPEGGAFAPALVLNPDGPERFSLTSRVAISSDFTPQETAAIVSAADNWREATAGAVDLELSIGDAGDLVVELGELPEGATGGTYGSGYPGARLVLARSMLETVTAWKGSPGYATVVTGTVEHELGHAFGVGHLPSGLMRWDHRPMGEPIDPEAVNALLELHP